MIDLDVAIAAIRRPNIFRLTASSFEKNLFRDQFRTRAIINIDPLGGQKSDGSEVEKIARDHFSQVIVRHPERPSFAAAVKWAWSNASTPWIFHLEDDWLLLRRVRLETLVSEMNEAGVQAVRLYLRRNTNRLYSSRLSLNPSLIKLQLVQRILSDFKLEKDPEKQIPHLPDGERVRNHGPSGAPRMVLDIGKKWRKAEGIEKRFENGASIFVARNRQGIRQKMFAVKRDYFTLYWRMLTALSELRRSY